MSLPFWMRDKSLPRFCKEKGSDQPVGRARGASMKCKSKRSGGEAASTPQQSEAATADASATGTLAL